MHSDRSHCMHYEIVIGLSKYNEWTIKIWLTYLGNIIVLPMNYDCPI